jgi:mannose-1-phosphate guanylyltransferase/mannose-6-phosphate isomerase
MNTNDALVSGTLVPARQKTAQTLTSSDTVLVRPVIMAGGSGTRLWPLSRGQSPKQFLALPGSGSKTLFQQALMRTVVLSAPNASVAAPIVVGNEAHRFMLLEQMRELHVEPAAVLLEPEGRNTAPALTLAALQAIEDGSDPVLVVTPADQMVGELDGLGNALRTAVNFAAHDAIVILGITPDRPETGYGYIKSRVSRRCAGAREVQSFVEKPDLATAGRYLAEGGYSWNSGMFVLRASTWLAALAHYRGDIAQVCRAAWSARARDGHFVRPGAAEFAAVPAQSVDHAVLERCAGGDWPLLMVPLQAGWSDLGAWDAVWQNAPKDERGNVLVGDALVQGAHNTLVHATHRLVGVIGLSDVVVVETPDAVLVADRARSQEVKQLADGLKAAGRSELDAHRLVHRPWGSYDSIDAGPRFQVKRIVVKPGARLSLQMHHHRAEHWIVVRGTAEVTCGERTQLLGENESTYIPLGVVHRLANPGKLPLELIEVQSGSYLGEDDIVRFEDVYGRG